MKSYTRKLTGEKMIVDPDLADPPCPSLLLYQLRSRKCTVGELVDLANSLPSGWVCSTAVSIAGAIREDWTETPLRRRKLVLLGALLNRLIFELENIPKSRSASI